ncbi:methyl-accepting chemotaxis protein [Actinoplanes sp. NBRC 103695]|uniref:methyl-accepting chemotaxis protein n=1 Tax=Actinoplanes sp. NBRC 103695 TaxID=3032202 RepID=UPI0025537DFA|nr:methyl-accepting chemotaxis protein [Actinoplanes sp. NBRC 103695]
MSFALVVALAFAAGVLGIGISQRQQQAAQQVSRYNAIAQEVLELSRHNSDINGMQAFYIWDVNANGLAGLTSDTGFRSTLLTEKKVIADIARRIGARPLTEEQRASLVTIEQNLESFWTSDDKVAADFLAGRTAQANKMYLASDNYTPIAEATASLVGSTTTQARVAAAAADRQASQARTMIIAVLAFSLMIAVLVTLLITRSVVVPVRQVMATMQRFSERDLTAAEGKVTSARDELGDMQSAAVAAVTAVRETVSTMSSAARNVASASAVVRTISAEASESTRDTAGRAGQVAEIAQGVSRSTQTVAAGAEEMGTSIREIADNATGAARVAADAVLAANATNTTVNKLGESSNEISNVVKLITAIAEQTNLLALNATIEAARAGDAGKGFAVVASEVKDLAQETAKATDDISRRVAAIQTDSEDAVTAIASITRIIGDINSYQATIASAVEEQTATTGEMSRSVAEIADGNTRMAREIVSVSELSSGTLQTLTTTEQAVSELALASRQLNDIVDTFRL